MKSVTVRVSPSVCRGMMGLVLPSIHNLNKDMKRAASTFGVKWEDNSTQLLLQKTFNIWSVQPLAHEAYPDKWNLMHLSHASFFPSLSVPGRRIWDLKQLRALSFLEKKAWFVLSRMKNILEPYTGKKKKVKSREETKGEIYNSCWRHQVKC